MTPSLAAALLVGYLCGSVPFGLLLTRLAGLGDIRSIGSGNIGATNVLRTGNKALAAATVLADALKGTVPILAARFWLGDDAALAAAIGAFLGHCFPVWLGFKGGKGVATFLGCLLAIDWRLPVAFAVVWLGVAALSRFSSLASLCATLISALAAFLLQPRPAALVVLLLAALAWLKHAPNIGRLLARTEGRIGAKA